MKNINPKDRAQVIEWLRTNDPIPLFLETIKNRHVGDEALALAHVFAAHSIGLVEAVSTLHIYTIGQSGKGKGHIANSVLLLFPPGNVVSLASFSPKAFFYTELEELNKKIMHSSELTIPKGDEDKKGLLRILTDSSSENAQSEHWTLDDKKKKIRLKIEGRISFWFNSETPIEDSQLKNRLLLGNPDESFLQDEKVHEKQKKRMGLLQEENDNQNIELCQAINREILLEDGFDVFIPYTEYIDFSAKQNRRLFPLFISLLKSVTKVQVFRRQQFSKIGGGKTVPILVSTPEDFDVAAWIWNSLFSVTNSQVSQQALELLKHIPTGQDNASTKTDLAEKQGWSSDWCYRKASELYNAGLINSDKRDGKRIYWKSSRSSRSKIGVQVNWQNFDSNTLQGVFQEISVPRSEIKALEDYYKIEAHFQKFTPSWLESIVLAESNKKQEISSESKNKPSLSKTPSCDYETHKVEVEKNDLSDCNENEQ